MSVMFSQVEDETGMENVATCQLRLVSGPVGGALHGVPLPVLDGRQCVYVVVESTL